MTRLLHGRRIAAAEMERTLDQAREELHTMAVEQLVAQVEHGQRIQPYYAAWCRSQGLPVAAQPGRGHEYIIWISGQWREWGHVDGRPLSDADREAFGAWLATRYPGTDLDGAAVHSC